MSLNSCPGGSNILNMSLNSSFWVDPGCCGAACCTCCPDAGLLTLGRPALPLRGPHPLPRPPGGSVGKVTLWVRYVLIATELRVGWSSSCEKIKDNHKSIILNFETVVNPEQKGYKFRSLEERYLCTKANFGGKQRKQKIERQ